MSFESTDDGYIAKILLPAPASDVLVGTAVAVMVEDEALVSAFKDFAAPLAASAAAPVAAPVAAAPVAPAAAAAPPVKAASAPPPPPPPAAVPAAAPLPAPTAPPAAESGPGYVAFEPWGASLVRSPLSVALAKQQNAYADMFGYTGHDPLPLPVEKPVKPAKA